jgi:hypothetical protein
MFPKEHGAYGQLGFPLLTALFVAGASITSVLIASAAVAGFLAHEPLLVLTGHRGLRAKREHHASAIVWLVVTGGAVLLCGTAAAYRAPADARWSFAFPLVPAVLLIAALALDREKTAVGELLVTVAFSFLAIPICIIGGAGAAAAFAIALVFAIHFGAATLSVRTIILKVRGGGNPHATRATRQLLVAFVVITVGTMSALVVRGTLPMASLLAILPGVAVALAIGVTQPSPARLRTIGWTLVATSVAVAAILIVGL